MIEDTAGIANLRAMLTEVPGIAAVLIGEGDLSQELGVPRQYDHPAVREAMGEVLAVCREMKVVCGHPHVDAQNAKRVMAEGYRFLMCAPSRSYAGLDAARQLAGRE
jgi:4-hydroxy-2-oxoheptanedioate aldolase